MLGIPERTWRRRQAQARVGAVEKGPWPAPVRRDAEVVAAVRAHAAAHPTWGHRRVRALVRDDGLEVSEATVLRIMRESRPAPRPAACPPARDPAPPRGEIAAS